MFTVTFYSPMKDISEVLMTKLLFESCLGRVRKRARPRVPGSPYRQRGGDLSTINFKLNCRLFFALLYAIW